MVKVVSGLLYIAAALINRFVMDFIQGVDKEEL